MTCETTVDLHPTLPVRRPSVQTCFTGTGVESPGPDLGTGLGPVGLRVDPFVTYLRVVKVRATPGFGSCSFCIFDTSTPSVKRELYWSFRVFRLVSLPPFFDCTRHFTYAFFFIGGQGMSGVPGHDGVFLKGVKIIYLYIPSSTLSIYR